MKRPCLDSHPIPAAFRDRCRLCFNVTEPGITGEKWRSLFAEPLAPAPGDLGPCPHRGMIVERSNCGRNNVYECELHDVNCTDWPSRAPRNCHDCRKRGEDRPTVAG